MAQQTNTKKNKSANVASGISSTLGGIASLASNAINAAQISDTTELDNQINSLANTNYQLGDYDSLMAAWDPLATNISINESDIRGMSSGEKVGSVLGGISSGASAGATFGPWGALIGGAIGGITSGIGVATGDRKAKLAAEEKRADLQLAANQNINNFNLNASRIGDNMFRNSLLNMAKYGGPLKFAFGGQTEFSNGVETINNGGTHEENIYGGVNIGGNNFAEEGEVIYDDYVYSNRLKPTKKQLEDIKLPSKYFGKTYAEIADVIQEASKETPYDPIERRGLNDSMMKLRAIQDETKEKLERKEFMREFNKLSDEDKYSLVNYLDQMASQQEQQRLAEEEMAAQQNQQQQQPQAEMGGDEYSDESTPNEEAMIAQQMNQYNNALSGYAFGGKLFPNGGIVYDRTLTKEQAKAYENAENYRRWLSIINDVKSGNTDVDGYNRKKQLVDAAMAVINADADMNGYKLKDYADYYRLASDGKIGPVHKLSENFITDNARKINNKNGIYDNLARPTAIPTPAAVTTATTPAQPVGYQEWLNVYDNNYEPQRQRSKFDTAAFLDSLPMAITAGKTLADLFAKPNYSLWDNAANSINRRTYVSPNPIGGYLAYNPFDQNYMQGRIAAQNAMMQRNILNTSSGNRGAAMSGLLAANQQAVNNIGDLAAKAMQANDEQSFKIAQHNVGIDNANAGRAQSAQAQNANNDMQRNNQLMQLAAQKQGIYNDVKQTNADNLSSLATLAGKYGQSVYNRNMINALIDRGVYPDLSSAVNNKCGGKIQRRKK